MKTRRLSILTVLAFVSIACEPRAIIGFGDSITDDWESNYGDRHNVSYILGLEELVRPLYYTEEYGRGGATCPRVRDVKVIPELARTRYGRGDVIVLMCHTLNFWHTPLAAGLEAVLDIKEMVEATGAAFVFASQPAWHVDHATNVDSREFYDTLFPLLGDIVIIDNDRIWKEKGYNLDMSNYSDGIHMTRKGSEILGDELYDTLCDKEVIVCEEDIVELYLNRMHK